MLRYVHIHASSVRVKVSYTCSARLFPPDWLPQLDGAWQLVFSAPNKAIPAWSYIPVNEDAVFDAKRGTTSLASDLGPFHFDFIGDFSWDEACQVLTLGGGPVTASGPQ